MKRIALLLALTILAGEIAFTAPVSGRADEEASPIYGVNIPAGYGEMETDCRGPSSFSRQNPSSYVLNSATI